MWLRRSLLFGVALAPLTSFCSSTATSTLVTVRSAQGSGRIDFSVENSSESAINNAYLAKTEKVSGAGFESNQPGSSAETEVWGADVLSRAIPPGARINVPVAEPGRWDVRVVDKNGRYQHISGLRLGAGGRYILRISEGGWRVF